LRSRKVTIAPFASLGRFDLWHNSRSITSLGVEIWKRIPETIAQICTASVLQFENRVSYDGGPRWPIKIITSFQRLILFGSKRLAFP
jgi:hypothetical protein